MHPFSNCEPRRQHNKGTLSNRSRAKKSVHSSPHRTSTAKQTFTAPGRIQDLVDQNVRRITPQSEVALMGSSSVSRRGDTAPHLPIRCCRSARRPEPRGPGVALIPKYRTSFPPPQQRRTSLHTNVLCMYTRCQGTKQESRCFGVSNRRK